MIDATLNSLLVAVLALNLFALGTSRLRTLIHIVAAQGAMLGTMMLLVDAHTSAIAILVSLVAILLKGFVIPIMLIRALRDTNIKREIEPFIGFLPSMLLGALATGGAILFAGHMPLINAPGLSLAVPASLATVLVGFILLTTRFKAISQVIGYLVLDNGVFIFGLLLIEAMPLVVEMGVLLDLFVGIFVICIIVNHINRAFSSLDTRRLVELRD